MWEDHPKEMDAALVRHDEILRSAIEKHDGYVFSLAGDAFAVAFHTPAEAIDAVERMQRDLTSEPWPEHTPIRVRIGVHTGTSEERNGDYFGGTLNRAARLMSAAHGGQVLVSAATHETTASREALDLGIHRLKDLSAPEHVWQLHVEGLPTNFAPIRTLDETKTSLPVRPVNLVGRTDDLFQIEALFRDHDIVTVCGPGGVGKTSLAIQAAANAAGRASGGVWLVELAPVRDADGVPFAFLDGMRIANESGRDPLETAIDAIGDDPTLLVVDNCEHVRESAARTIRSIVDSCQNAAVMATSREPLGLSGEASFAIEPLSSATPDSPAVTLFIERARDANPALELTENATAAIVELCERLDGLPLAIELAAARTRSFTPADLNSRLDQRFRLLRTRSHESDRHATLRDTIAWSHQLLEPDERTLFERLSVFAGDFDLATVEAVCADDELDELDIFDILDRLVERSMVVAEVHGPKARFHLLQSLRDFAADEVDEPEIWKRRHAREYAAWMRRVVDGLYGQREEELLHELDNGWDDLRVAVYFARDTDDVALLEQLIAGMCTDLLFRARSELAEWATAALTMTDAPSIALLSMATVAASVMGDQESVVSRGQRYSEAATVEDGFDSMDALAVALAMHLAGEPDRALSLYEVAMERVPAEKRQVVGAWEASLRALLFTYTGRPEEAAAAVGEAKRLIADQQVGTTLLTGYELVDTLRMIDPPEVIVERMQAVSRSATRVKSTLVKNVADMTAATAAAQLGDTGKALMEAADVLTEGGQRSFLNLSQQLRGAAVLLMREGVTEIPLLILGYLELQRAPAPNPAVGAQIDELSPVARAATSDEDFERISLRASTIKHSILVDETVAAMKASARDSAGES